MDTIAEVLVKFRSGLERTYSMECEEVERLLTELDSYNKSGDSYGARKPSTQPDGTVTWSDYTLYISFDSIEVLEIHKK